MTWTNCADCGKPALTVGSGLCQPCYSRNACLGRLGRYSAAVAAREDEDIKRAKARVRQLGLSGVK